MLCNPRCIDYIQARQERSIVGEVSVKCEDGSNSMEELLLLQMQSDEDGVRCYGIPPFAHTPEFQENPSRGIHDSISMKRSDGSSVISVFFAGGASDMGLKFRKIFSFSL
ncbi:hypothetical protein GW17_00032009 [Ensete ventricosum]|nr:hypothetical protein GW17_00032009 [Ensete ventricosum]RZR92350.1 hypothetical protein BHM03_00020623 [Ensete ventricosum]